MVLPITSFTFQVMKVCDREKIVAIELTNGRETWFYDFRDSSLSIGKVPRKSLDEEYERKVIYQLPTHDMNCPNCGESTATRRSYQAITIDRVVYYKEFCGTCGFTLFERNG